MTVPPTNPETVMFHLEDTEPVARVSTKVDILTNGDRSIQPARRTPFIAVTFAERLDVEPQDRHRGVNDDKSSEQ
jgi:hypothetical protein